jgi:putative oxidoreductase
MKIVKQIPAYLLALVYVGAGLAFFLKAMPEQPMNDAQKTFMQLFGGSGWMTFIKACEVLFGALLILPKTRALALVLIAPISVNILAFELFIANQPGIGIVLVALNAAAIFINREKYSSILA